MSTTTIQYFDYKHLPIELHLVARHMYELAHFMEELVPDGPEKSAGMRKLLEAKDCFVRAKMLPQQASFEIFINGRPITIENSGPLTYEQIVVMAGFRLLQRPTVTVRMPKQEGRILCQGETINIEESGLIINAAATGNA